MSTARDARLPGFPRCRLLALVDDRTGARDALHALATHAPRTGVQVLAGERGVDALDVSGARRGLLGRFLRALQDVAYDRGALALHDAHLERGGFLLLVPTRHADDACLLARLLAGEGAHGLVWFGRCSVVDVTPRRRSVSTPAVLVTTASPTSPAPRPVALAA